MLAFLFLILLSPLHALAQETPMVLSLGETKTLFISGSSTVWVEKKETLKAEGAGNRLTVRGVREGVTFLKVGTQTYKVQVLHPQKTNIFQSFNKLISSLVGLETEMAEGEIVVKGRLYRLKDWLKISEFAKKHSINFKMQINTSEELKNEMQNHFNEILKGAHLPSQSLVFEPKLEVRINTSELNTQRFKSILGPFGISIQRDENSLEIEPTIRVEITVAEIKRNLSLKYGLRWPSSYSAKVLNTGEAELDSLPFNLSALENNGFGKVLASPNILCRSGKEAEFLAGGEFPIKIINYKTQDIVWKRYGILLKVKPKADASGRISLSIETEVTTLDDSRKVDDIPGLLTNRVSSHFDLTRPQTIALSGLIKNEEGKSREGVPLISRIPILGSLFASKDFRENRSELVIFVRPTILSSEEPIEIHKDHLKKVGVSL